MKGIIFNLLENAIAEEFGEAAFERVLDDAGSDGVYTSVGSYPDDDLVRLIEATARLRDQDMQDTLRWLGRAAIPDLATAYPEFFDGHRDTRSFILTLNDVIHPEVRKLYAGAGCPHFQFDTSRPDRLLLGYRSPRQLCRLAEGFVQGASHQYGQQAKIEHLSCMLDGESICRILVQWI